MAEESFSLDSLLEDLDAAVVHSPAGAPAQSSTVRFVPHPPPKTVTQGTVHNPKNRFVHTNSGGSGSTSPDGPAAHSFGANATFNGANQNAYYSAPAQQSAQQAGSQAVSAANTQDVDENSIDNLLNLMNSPQQGRPTQTIKPTSPHNNNTYQGFDNHKAFGAFGQNMNKASHNSDLHAPHSNTHTSAHSTTHNNNTSSNNSSGAAYNHSGGTTLEISGFSSPFDSPSSHGSASTGPFSATRKTHSNSILNSHSDSSYSFDTAGASTNKAIVFPAPFALPGESNGNNKTRSGAGVSGSLFGKTDAVAVSKSTLLDIASNSNSSYSGASSGGSNNANNNGNTHAAAHTTTGTNKGNTVTFTSQQKQTNNAPFLPPSINATTVVSNTSAVNTSAVNTSVNSGASGASGGYTSLSSAAVSSGSKARCTRVIIAGPSMERGRKTSAFAQLACNNLRCIQCNFKVHCFANSAWDSSVDYMFLRNTVPNEVKLAQRLQRSAESCAYCCQCSHTNESGERELTAQTSSGDPQWVCAGH